MTKPIIRIHDLETDEITEREMTAAELKKAAEKVAAEEAEIATKAAEKDALLAKLGITQDEANLLLG